MFQFNSVLLYVFVYPATCPQPVLHCFYTAAATPPISCQFHLTHELNIVHYSCHDGTPCDALILSLWKFCCLRKVLFFLLSKLCVSLTFWQHWVPCWHPSYCFKFINNRDVTLNLHCTRLHSAADFPAMHFYPEFVLCSLHYKAKGHSEKHAQEM